MKRSEIGIIRTFMPKQMDEGEAKAAIQAVIAETGAASIKDMGKVMAVLKERYAGQMDFGKASRHDQGRAVWQMSDVKVAQSDADIARCFPVMRQLRPHLKDEAEFVSRCRAQMAECGWSLIYVEDGGAVAGVAGFRIQHFLHSGKTLYVDDLVTDEGRRSKGFGEALLGWMENHARAQGCQTFSLDSGTQRTGAHKFYFRQGLPITSFHFAKKL